MADHFEPPLDPRERGQAFAQRVNGNAAFMSDRDGGQRIADVVASADIEHHCALALGRPQREGGAETCVSEGLLQVLRMKIRGLVDAEGAHLGTRHAPPHAGIGIISIDDSHAARRRYENLRT